MKQSQLVVKFQLDTTFKRDYEVTTMQSVSEYFEWCQWGNAGKVAAC